MQLTPQKPDQKYLAKAGKSGCCLGHETVKKCTSSRWYQPTVQWLDGQWQLCIGGKPCVPEEVPSHFAQFLDSNSLQQQSAADGDAQEFFFTQPDKARSWKLGYGICTKQYQVRLLV